MGFFGRALRIASALLIRPALAVSAGRSNSASFPAHFGDDLRSRVVIVCRAWSRSESRSRDHRQGQPSVGVVRIPAAIPAVLGRLKIVDPGKLAQPAGALDIQEKDRSLLVHIGRDVMRELARGMADPRTAIEGCRTNPNGAAFRV